MLHKKEGECITAHEDLYAQFKEIIDSTNQDVSQENANADGKSPMGIMGNISSAAAKAYARKYLLTEEVKGAMDAGYVHIHDLDFYASGTTTCIQIPLAKILKDGFNTGHGFMREPNGIMSAMALASIIFQSNQNQQHGGQSMSTFDHDLAPYVKKTFNSNVKMLAKYGVRGDLEELAWEKTDEDVYQACEAFIHNSNSMHSRGGGQVPFISINFGMDTSPEGRMITKNILKATQAGLGNGETAIFPISIFKVKDGVNANKRDPNYDLFRLSLETTAKRLFPNYLFVDAPQNIKHYKGTPETQPSTMGCRTRVLENNNGEVSPIGRGNLSFSTINLPMIALESATEKGFFNQLDKYIDVLKNQLLERYDYQSSRTANSFKFLYGEGLWKNSESLKPHDRLGEVLKQGTLSIGYVGLAEALVALIGEHHGESDEAQELGLKIIRHMRKKTDELAKETGHNFSVLATPAESYAGRALRMTREKHGVIEGITDKDWFTNSNHVPVEYHINAYNKIKVEAPYHELTNAGHITYVELEEDASKNIGALETLVKHMRDSGIGYGSFNVPVDRCTECGFTSVIYDECPKCGNTDENKIDRIRRITGYLTGTLDKWNTAKKAEENSRVRHGKDDK